MYKIQLFDVKAMLFTYQQLIMQPLILKLVVKTLIWKQDFDGF
jgi:hypothetical protein